MDFSRPVATDDDAQLAAEFRDLLTVNGERKANPHRMESYVFAGCLGALYGLVAATFAPTWLVPGLAADTVLRLACFLLALWPAYRHAKWVMAHVDLDRTFAWHARTLILENGAPRPRTPQRASGGSLTRLQ